jgi:hypothetical protein
MIISWRKMKSAQAAYRNRFGAKIRKGTNSSIANIIAVEARWNQTGNWYMYQLIQFGNGWVS